MYRPVRDSDGAGRHDVDVSGNLFVVFTRSRASVPTFAVRPVRLQVQHFALVVRRPVPQAISSELTHREYTLITNHDEIPSRLRTCITSNRITSAQARIEPVLIRLHRVSPDSWHGAQGRLAGLENGAECFATLAEPVELVCQ